MVQAKDFWKRLATSRAEIEQIIASGLMPAGQERLIALFGEAFDGHGKELVFEFGIAPDSVPELIISADGISKRIPAVLDLVKSPARTDMNALPGWRVVAFRTRKPLDMMIDLGEHRCAIAKTRVKWTDREERLDVVVYLDVPPGIPRQVVSQIGFLALDVAIGEYDVMTKIGNVQTKPLPANADMLQLPTVERFITYFDSYFSAISGGKH